MTYNHPTYISPEKQRELLGLRDTIVAVFEHKDWIELGLQTGNVEIIQRHGRLLRSLNFGDPDYSGASLEVLLSLVRADPDNLRIIKETVTFRMGEGGENISTAALAGRVIVFRPGVFHVPEGSMERDLVAVMTPFAPAFEPVFTTITAACASASLRCLRARDIWEHEAVIQDIFSLIFRASIVVCDFTGRNPNVFYEAGIAHALGKHVVPLTQVGEDIPFDLRHHRYLSYLNNQEGRDAMQGELASRLSYLAGQD